jgi:hypothetical protein
VREAIESLEAEYPGVKDRLCEEGKVSYLKMREKFEEDSEVHFVNAISGG